MKELVIKVWGSNTYKRTYFNSVSCDGVNLIAPWGAPGNTYRNVQVLEVIDGGYTRGDGNHAWTAEYTLRIRCPEGAEVKRIGRQLSDQSGFEILSKETVNA